MRAIFVNWTPKLEEALTVIYMDSFPVQAGDVSTPELLVVEAKKRRARAAVFITRLKCALERHQTDCLDLELTEAVERLKLKGGKSRP